MSDLIDRQEAIETILKLLLLGEDSLVESVEECNSMIEGAADILKSLPSAQSDIIRCKECKHRYIENEVWACPFGLAGGPDFYCGYGSERRTDE